jgi:hypothetical protein
MCSTLFLAMFFFGFFYYFFLFSLIRFVGSVFYSSPLE